jgi:site-specific DNA-cytosine methylase
MPTFRTLFSGGELFGIGACAAGYTHVDGFEIRADIAAVAQLNGFDVRVANVCDVDYESLAAVDHLHASPSCKNASQAKTDGGETDADRAAAGAICHAIRAHAGRSFSLENVWNYRAFEGFARILAALHACGFVVDVRHVNAADYGVPQTRKRLILRAVRRAWRDRVPPLHPTHRKGGDMFCPPWIGWYQAIQDIIDTLPASQFAPWQLARLPRGVEESLLVEGIGSGNRGAFVPCVPGSEPAWTIGTNGRGRAFLIGSGNTQIAQADSKARWDDEPMFMIANGSALRSRALLVGGQYARGDADPDRWVQTAAQGNGTIAHRAVLVSPAMSQHGDGVITRTASEPAVTIVAGTMDRQLVRAWLARGRVVKMTVQALGRFQTVPDSYRGLTAEINGNGVPCLLAQRITESLL